MPENWEAYLCQIEDKPASIVVNLALRDDAPLADLEDLVWIRVALLDARVDGLWSDEEAETLGDIEDALSLAVEEAEGAIVYVGRTTCDGSRDFFFYATDGMSAEARLSAAMVPFPSHEFETGTKNEPEWTAYLEFLYPSPRDFQLITNEQLSRLLISSGDDSTIVREVSHWAYFESPEGRAQFLAEVLTQGFTAEDQSDDDTQIRPYRLTFAREETVDLATMNHVTLNLYDLALTCEGVYDGWETTVEKPKPE